MSIDEGLPNRIIDDNLACEEYDTKMKISNEAIDITIGVLNNTSKLHYKSCLEDVSGRPDFNCSCPIKDIIEKLTKLKEQNNA